MCRSWAAIVLVLGAGCIEITDDETEFCLANPEAEGCPGDSDAGGGDPDAGGGDPDAGGGGLDAGESDAGIDAGVPLCEGFVGVDAGAIELRQGMTGFVELVVSGAHPQAPLSTYLYAPDGGELVLNRPLNGLHLFSDGRSQLGENLSFAVGDTADLIDWTVRIVGTGGSSTCPGFIRVGPLRVVPGPLPPGSDGGNGTVLNPFVGLTRALRSANGGNTIELTAGVYSEATGEQWPAVPIAGATPPNVTQALKVRANGKAILRGSYSRDGGRSAALAGGPLHLDGLEFEDFLHAVVHSGGDAGVSHSKFAGVVDGVHSSATAGGLSVTDSWFTGFANTGIFFGGASLDVARSTFEDGGIAIYVVEQNPTPPIVRIEDVDGGRLTGLIGAVNGSPSISVRRAGVTTSSFLLSSLGTPNVDLTTVNAFGCGVPGSACVELSGGGGRLVWDGGFVVSPQSPAVLFSGGELGMKRVTIDARGPLDAGAIVLEARAPTSVLLEAMAVAGAHAIVVGGGHTVSVHVAGVPLNSDAACFYVRSHADGGIFVPTGAASACRGFAPNGGLTCSGGGDPDWLEIEGYAPDAGVEFCVRH